MAIESLPVPTTTQTSSQETWVVITPDGAHIATHPTAEQLATLIARRLRPDVWTVNPNPTEREIRRILGQYTSEQHGAVSKDMQDKIATKLRRQEE